MPASSTFWSAALAAVLVLPLHAADSEAPVCRPYDLADVIGQALQRDYPPRHLGFDSVADPILNVARPTTNQTFELAAFLDQRFEPQIATRLREASELHGTTLFLTATPTLHRKIAETLAAASTQAKRQVVVSAHLVLMEPDVRKRRFGLPEVQWRTLTNAPFQQWADLTPSEAKNISTSLVEDRDVTFVENPVITVFNGQLASSYAAHQITFAKPSPLAGAKPVLDRVSYGSFLAVRATVTSDRASVHLVLDHRDCEVVEAGRTLNNHTEAPPVLWQAGEHWMRRWPSIIR